MTKKSLTDTRVCLKRVRELLRDATFNPKENGPLKFVVETASPEFYESQAIILIREASVVRAEILKLRATLATVVVMEQNQLDNLKQSLSQEAQKYQVKMTRAIQLLVLAEIYTE